MLAFCIFTVVVVVVVVVVNDVVPLVFVVCAAPISRFIWRRRRFDLGAGQWHLFVLLPICLS